MKEGYKKKVPQANNQLQGKVTDAPLGYIFNKIRKQLHISILFLKKKKN